MRALAIAVVVASIPGWGCSEDRAHALVVVARADLAADRAEEARVRLERAVELDPTSREAWSLLADEALVRRAWRDAEWAAARAISIADPSAHDHKTRARTAIAESRWGDAASAIDRAIARGGSEPELLLMLARIQDRCGCEGDAIATFLRAFALGAEDGGAHRDLGRLVASEARRRAHRPRRLELHLDLASLALADAPGEWPDAYHLALLGELRRTRAALGSPRIELFGEDLVSEPSCELDRGRRSDADQ